MSFFSKLFSLGILCLAFCPYVKAEVQDSEPQFSDVVQEKYNRLHRLDVRKVTLNTSLVLLVVGGDSTRNLLITPYATGPDGKVHLGPPVTAALATGEVQLEVTVKHPFKGSYVVGGFISLEDPTNPLPPTTIGLSGSVSGKLGNQFQAALIPSSLFGAPLLNPPTSFVCSYSTAFQMIIPLPIESP